MVRVTVPLARAPGRLGNTGSGIAGMNNLNLKFELPARDHLRVRLLSTGGLGPGARGSSRPRACAQASVRWDSERPSTERPPRDQ